MQRREFQPNPASHELVWSPDVCVQKRTLDYATPAPQRQCGARFGPSPDACPQSIPICRDIVRSKSTPLLAEPLLNAQVDSLPPAGRSVRDSVTFRHGLCRELPTHQLRSSRKFELRHSCSIRALHSASLFGEPRDQARRGRPIRGTHDFRQGALRWPVMLLRFRAAVNHVAFVASRRSVDGRWPSMSGRALTPLRSFRPVPSGRGRLARRGERVQQTLSRLGGS